MTNDQWYRRFGCETKHPTQKSTLMNLLQMSCVIRNIGIVIFDFRGHGGCWRPKTPLGGQKRHEGVDLMKKEYNKSCSTTSKTP